MTEPPQAPEPDAGICNPAPSRVTCEAFQALILLPRARQVLGTLGPCVTASERQREVSEQKGVSVGQPHPSLDPGFSTDRRSQKRPSGNVSLMKGLEPGNWRPEVKMQIRAEKPTKQSQARKSEKPNCLLSWALNTPFADLFPFLSAAPPSSQPCSQGADLALSAFRALYLVGIYFCLSCHYSLKIPSEGTEATLYAAFQARSVLWTW